MKKNITIKKGYIVKMKDGRIGMVVWRKSNDDIGINFGHYHIITNTIGKDNTPTEQRDWIMKMGVDGTFDKTEIIEVIRDGKIYN